MIKRIHHKIKDSVSQLKIRHKIMFFYLTLVMINIAISVLIYQQTNAYYSNQKMKEIAIRGIEEDSRSLEILIEDINYYSKLIIANKNIQQTLQNGYYYGVTRLSTVEDTLSEFNNFNAKVASIYIFDSSGKKYYIGNSINQYVNYERVRGMSFYDKLVEEKGGYIIVPVDPALNSAIEEAWSSFARVINSLDTQEPIGMILMNLEKSEMEKSLGFDTPNNETLLVVNAYGQVIINHQDNPGIDEASFLPLLDEKGIFWKTLKVGNQKMIVTGYMNSKSGWKHIKVIPFQESFMQLNTLNAGLLSIVLANVILVLLGSLFISKKITDPLHSLIVSMKGVEKGNFEPVCIRTNKDEMGLLKEVYNYMISKIQVLIHEIIQEQKIKRTAEIDILMAQIKPHFLYNTIDSINALILLERWEEAHKSLTALGHFYRTSLNNGRDFITIREEINLIKNYLYIQKIRYRDLFEVEYQIDPEILEVKVPKLILQPLVENSIYHGLRPTGGNGKIFVSIAKMEEKVQFIIQDTGIGMSKEQIVNIQTSSKKSIGIHATKERIRILYGEKSLFKIESELGMGTEITIEIPLEGIEEVAFENRLAEDLIG